MASSDSHFTRDFRAMAAAAATGKSSSKDDYAAWASEVLPPDELEFPPEIESQLAAVLAMDDYYDYTAGGGGGEGIGGRGGARKPSSAAAGGSAAADPEDVWDDLGLEDFVLSVQREQRLLHQSSSSSAAGEGGAVSPTASSDSPATPTS